MANPLLASITHTHLVSDLSTYNFAAGATAPTATDSAPQYEVGSLWLMGTSNQAYCCTDSTSGAAVWALMAALGSSGLPYAVVRDVQTSGTNGQALAAMDTWFVRRLNTLTGTASSSVALASDQLTLQPGTYFVYASFPMSQLATDNGGNVPGRMYRPNKIRIFNVTDNVVQSEGANCTTSAGSTQGLRLQQNAILFTVITVTGSAKVFQFECWVNSHPQGNTVSGCTCGMPQGLAATSEVYNLVTIAQLA